MRMDVMPFFVYSFLGFIWLVHRVQSAHIIYNNPTYVTLLSVRNGSLMSAFDLWNATGIQCHRDGLFLRHDYIDRLTTACTKEWEMYLFNKNEYIRIKYAASSDTQLQFIKLKPVFIEDRTTTPITYLTTNGAIPDGSFFLDKDNFEFLWLNPTLDKMHAGWYYDVLVPTNSPKFFFNSSGVPYSPGVDFSQIATDIEYMDLVLTLNSSCTVDVRNESYCPGPNVTSGMTEMEVPYESSAEIPCSILTPFYVTSTTWTYNGNTIDFSSTPLKYSKNGSNLLIHDFKSSDNGIYACLAADLLGQGQGDDVTLTMIGPPILIIPTEEYNLDTGNKMTLECQDNSNPPISDVFWLRNDQQIQTVGNSNYSGSNISIPSLTILTASFFDLGIYKCCATNAYQTSTTACGKPLMVIGEPHVRIPDTLYEFYIGQNIEMDCSFKSYPAATDVFWKKDDIRLQDNSNLNYSNFSGTPSLLITGMDPNDRGRYECCVTNLVATKCGKRILLGGKPTVTVPDTNVNGTRKTDITLYCDVEAFPVPVNISWGVALFDSEIHYDGYPSIKYEMNPSDSGPLIVKSLEFPDTGNYLCIAENQFGDTNSSIVTLEVYGVLVLAPITNYSILYGDSVELNCTVIYAPDLQTVTWTFTNESRSQTVDTSDTVKYGGSTIYTPHLTISTVDFSDAGSYKCTAGNIYETDNSANWITLNIRGALPTVTVIQFYVIANTSDQVTLTCTYDGEPTVSSITWYKNANGVITELSRPLSSPSLTISNLALSDAGNYTCCAVNAVGQRHSSIITLQVNQVQEMCPCSCAYKERLDYWATQDTPNYTMEEWREVLAPVLEEIKQNLTVDVANLSATIRKRTSAPDDRKSSKSMGVLGIVLLSLVVASFVFIDIASIKRHCSLVKDAVKYR